MPPLTRASSRRAAESGSSAAQLSPPGLASAPPHLTLSSSTRLGDSISALHRSAMAFESSTLGPATTNPSSFILRDSTRPDDSSSATGSNQHPVQSSRHVLMDITRQSIPSPPKTGQPSWVMGITSVKGIPDLNLRDQVVRLQQLHPWAPTKLCLSMLMGCRLFGDADDALRKYAIKIPDTEDGKAVKSASGKVFKAGGLPVSTLVSISKDIGKKNKIVSNVKSKQQLSPFFKPMQPSSGVFSQAERQRAISASTETDLDQQRAAFVAEAVLYRAFSGPDYHNHGRVTKHYYPRFGLKHFPNSSALFSQSTKQSPPSRNSFKGTDRGKFRPLSCNSTEGIITLQSINLGIPYLKVSFEELRFGDWIRGRIKAPHLFDLFPKLPPEIRCMIWSHAMTPRVVELRHNYSVTESWSIAKIPITLHVCRESRYEALKRYSLAFGIRNSPDQIYFDFTRDTLFLTYEKDNDRGEYDGGLGELTYLLGQSEETKKVRLLAIDEELMSLWARILEDEVDEWVDIGDDDMPMPELEVIPEYESLQSLAIVQTKIDGFWSDEMKECRCGYCTPGLHKRMEQNNNADFVPVNPYNVVNRSRQDYYEQLIAKVKLGSPDWTVPELSYMIKRAPKSSGPT